MVWGMTDPSQEQLAAARIEALQGWHTLVQDRFPTDASRSAMASIHEVLITLGVVRDGPMPTPCHSRPEGVCYLRRCAQGQRCIRA